MKLYLSRDPESRVFHLRKNCPKGRELLLLSQEMVRHLRACGMKRICLKCRNNIGRAG